MAQQRPTIQLEDIPIEDARRMGRGRRVEPILYDTLRHKVQSLSTEAVRIHLGPEISQYLIASRVYRVSGIFAHALPVDASELSSLVFIVFFELLSIMAPNLPEE